MLVSSKVNQLIKNINALEPLLAENEGEAKESFRNLLDESIRTTSDLLENASISVNNIENAKKNNSNIPEWVDMSYGYDPKSPRKPNMKELIEALELDTINNLYKDPDKNWSDIVSQASDLLYGVVGDREDSRNWSAIMGSDRILESARGETREMLNPIVDIVSRHDNNGNVTAQFPIIKDGNNKLLRSLTGSVENTEKSMNNYGLVKGSVASDILTKITFDEFDPKIENLLREYSNQGSSINDIQLETASLAIASRLDQMTQLDEYEKL